jgi:hypothetical protein
LCRQTASALPCLNVDMDELMVAGGVGEFVDHILIDQNPFRRANGLTDHCSQFVARDYAHDCAS